MRKPGRGQILENRLVGPREVLGGGDRRVPAKGRGRTAPCRGRSGASWIWATPLTPARARGSSVRATPSLRPPRILKTSLFLQKGGPRKEPSQRTATALFYLIPCGDFQLSPREFYLSLIRGQYLRFPGESSHALPVLGKGFRQHLQGHFPVEFGVRSSIHLTHSTRPDLSDGVVSDGSADHRCSFSCTWLRILPSNSSREQAISQSGGTAGNAPILA